MEFGAFWLTQVDVIAFLPCWRAFEELAIIDNFDAHMELLRKLWVLNNLMADGLRTNSFSHLDVTNLYAIRIHLKSDSPREYFVHHSDGLVDNVEVCVTPTLGS